MKYLLYNRYGEVKQIYFLKPPKELIDLFYGCIEYDGEVEKKGHTTNITIDTKTKKVSVGYEKIATNDPEVERSVKQMEKDIDILSNALDAAFEMIAMQGSGYNE